MTNLEKLKSDDIKTVIEVVEECVFEAIGGGFDGDHDCYDRDCPYLETGQFQNIDFHDGTKSFPIREISSD